MTDLAPVLENPVAPAPAPLPDLGAPEAPVAPVTNFTFRVKGFEAPNPETGVMEQLPISMDTNRIPEEVKDYLLQNAIKAYVQNRTSTAATMAAKANAAFDLYDNALANDPLQDVVPKPEGERKVVDYAKVIRDAVTALYDNTIGKRNTGEGGGKKKGERKDPLVSAVTRAVVQEIFEKNYALDNNYKFPMAVKEVGQDGIAYLKNKMAANVAAGVATAEQMDYIFETKYMKPARIMLGLDQPGKLKDAVGIL